MAGINKVSGHGRRLTVLDCATQPLDKSILPTDHSTRGCIHLAKKAGFTVDRYPLLEVVDLSHLFKSLGSGGRLIITDSSLPPFFGSDDSNIRKQAQLHMLVQDVISFAIKYQITTLGIGYGAQMIASFAGANIVELPKYHFGFEEIHRTFRGHHHPLFSGLPGNFDVAKNHRFGIRLSDVLTVLAVNQVNPDLVEAFTLPNHKVVGVQFNADYHPYLVDGLGMGDLSFYGQANEGYLKSKGVLDPLRPHAPDRYALGNNVFDQFLNY